MPMTFRPCCAVVALALTVEGSAHAQVLASDQARREAFKHYRAGQELLSAEQFGKAAAAFETAVKVDARFTDAHSVRGQSDMGLQRYASAVHPFEATIEAARTLDAECRARRFSRQPAIVRRHQGDEVRDA